MDNKCTHCKTTLGEDFVYLNFGGLLKNEHGASCSDTIESFCTIGTHSHTNPTPSVDLEEHMQYNDNGQCESYFCNNICLINWFGDKLTDLPDPGTEEYKE